MRIPKNVQYSINRAKNQLDAIIYELEDTEYATEQEVDRLRKALYVLEDLADN